MIILNLILNIIFLNFLKDILFIIGIKNAYYINIEYLTKNVNIETKNTTNYVAECYLCY